MKRLVILVSLVLVVGACSDDDATPIFPTTTTLAAADTTVADPTTTTSVVGTTLPPPPEGGPCAIDLTGPVVHIDFDDLPSGGLITGPGREAVVAALAADGLSVTQYDHATWGGGVGPVTETDAIIADNPAAVTPDIPSLGSSSAPNVLRVFDEGHLSIAAHQTLPGQMDYLGFNVGFGHFSEGFERPDIVELDVSVTLLPFHEIDGSVTAVAWDPITITLGPGPQPITECVFLENPGVGHPLFSTWLVDIVPRHVDGTPIHLPVGIDDLFYGCYPSAAGGCGSPWTGAGYDLITFAHREFQQDFYGIYVVDPDIGDEIPLLIRTDNRDLGEPAWSPDGRWIAYTERGAPASPDAATINLYVIGGDGTGPFQITSGGNVYGHDWSPDGTRLVYGYGADDDDADLWIVDALGGVPERLTDLGDDFGAIEPAWSPDGALIAFERGERIDGIFWQSELYVVDSGGGLPELAATVPSHAGAVNHMHSWSPDSTRILYASHYEDGGGVVWIVDFASGTEMSVSGAISEALTPVWSPTGDRVAFFGFSGGTGIWRVNADGSGLTELPADPEWGSGIAWSSDGGRLAYTGSDAETAIWVIGTDGSLPVRVTELFGHEVDPDWSP